jgi:hypothetical protein
MTNRQTIKEELKALAKQIRIAKIEYKEGQRSFNVFSFTYGHPENLGDQFRLCHIAWSLARGRTYEQIENKVKDENKLSDQAWEKINSRRANYESLLLADRAAKEESAV